ncbi:MAG TPA: DUF6282 family protein [Bryobacteraceae bacterium]|nr:DUF6282 family protein [Bryobacteraceae bacterium]
MDINASTRLLKDVMDVHVHCGPDSIARPIDALDLARMAKSFGMRGFVVKSHFEPTAGLAYLVRKQVESVEVFGGIALNVTVGGINPRAVERMAMVEGHWGRMVWMPSFDSESHVKYHKEDRPYVSVSSGGQLLPEVKEVISVIAKYNLVLATSHSSARETLMLVREARLQNVKHVLVTHAMIAPGHMTIDQMIEAAEIGAYIEFVYNGLVGPHREFAIHEYAKAIRLIGIADCIISSDMGQMVNPVHPQGLMRFFEALHMEGFSEGEIQRMAKDNTADLLGLAGQKNRGDRRSW